MVYVVILIILTILNIFKFKEKTQKKISGIIFVFFTILSSMRKYTVGADTLQFWNIYRYIGINQGSIIDLRTESGFNLLCQILNKISEDPQILLIVTSIIINICVYKFIIKNTRNSLFATFLYFTLNYYFSSMNLMRQFLAISFVISGYNFLKDKKYFKYAIFVILASLFHSSAIFMMILIPIRIYNKNKNLIYITVAGSVILFILTPIIFNIGLNFYDYSKYLTSKYIDSSYVSAGLYTLTNFIFLLFGMLVPSKSNLEEKFMDDPIHKLNSWIIAIGTIVSAMSMRVSIFNRFFLYFNFFNIIWIPNSLELIKNAKNRNIYKFIIMIFTILYVYIITKMGWSGIWPYEFLWQ